MSLPVAENKASDGAGGKSSSPSDQINAGEVRAELERVLASRVFRHAKGQSRFLRFVVEEALEGRASNIKEYLIGVEVFDRGESFDPRTSNIVRTEANRLRVKLARYYEEEGRANPLRIDLPKGGYAPTFCVTNAGGLSVDRNGESASHHESASQGVPGGKPAGPAAQSAEADGVFSSAGPGSVASEHPVAESATRISGGVRWAITAGVILLAVLGATAAWRSLAKRSKAADSHSIVVLPFVNLSGQADEFFSDGLTDEIIDSLGRIPGLHVVARTSAFQYKGKNLDVRQIGHDLNVSTALEGTVRRDGERVRITVQLDDTSDGYRVWSRSFDRESNDVLTMQREISQAIADALGLELAGGLEAASQDRRKEPGNPDAYQSYLKGVYFSNKHTGENVRRAISYFEDAARKAPDYAPAYSGLARCYSMLPSFTKIPTGDVAGKWKAAALKALELDPTLSEAHIYLAENYMTEYDWRSAEREFQAGLMADPSNADGYRSYSLFLAKMGKLDAAITQARKAVYLDPVSAHASNSLGKYLYESRRFDEALRQYRYSMQLDPNEGITHQGMALVYLQKKMYREAIAESEACSKIMDRDPFITGQMAYAYALSGNEARAKEILGALLNEPSTRGTLSLAIANAYLGLKDKDQALSWLSKAADQHDVYLFVQMDPIYDPIRGDSRFTALLHRMNLN